MREKASTAKTYSSHSRLLAFVLVFAMLIGVCPAAFADNVVIGDNLKAKFVGTAVGDDKTVFTNSSFGLLLQATFNEPQGDVAGVANPELRLYVGDMAVTTFTSLKNGGKLTGLEPYIADGLQYTVKNDNDGQGNYILVQKYENGSTREWKAGDTVTTTLGVQFDGDAKTGTSWTVTPKIYTSDNSEYKAGTSDTVKAKSNVVMNNTKSVSPQSIMLPTVSGQTTLGTDLVYEISAFTGTESDDSRILAAGETRVTEYTVTDTFTLPAGLYISGSDSSAVSDALSKKGFSGYTISDVKTDSKGITGFTLTYTVKNDSMQQIENLKGMVTISGDKILASSEFTNAADNKVQITNKISTAYKTIDSPVKAIETAPAEVTTDVYRPASAEYTQISKTIDGVYSKYGTYNWWNNPYLVDGDYVLYKISFYNSGDTDLSGGTITDTLPDGLTVAKNDSDAVGKINYGAHNNDDLTTKGVCIHGGNAEINVSENRVSFSKVTVASKSWFNAYILAKITGTVTADTTRTNTARVGDTDVSVSFNQKPRAANIAISKSVTNETHPSLGSKYRAGDSIKYTVTVSNTGTADAENVKVTDLFPIHLFDNVEYLVDGGTKKNLTASNSTPNTSELFDLGTVTVPAGGSKTKTITVTGTVKSGISDSSISNTAYAEYNGNKVTANAVLYWDNPASYVTISKSGDKDGQYVAAGNVITYTITANTNGQIFDDSNPMKIRDVIPSGLAVVDAPAFSGADGMKMTPSNSGQEYDFSITGTGKCTITIKCKVNADVSDGTQFKNTAYVIGGNSSGASSGTSYKGVPDAIKAVKTAEVYRNDVKITDISSGGYGEVKAGDVIVFKIKVTNASENDVTRFTLHDTLIGKYKSVNTGWTTLENTHTINPGAYPIHMTISAVSDGVQGTDKNMIWNNWKSINCLTNSNNGSYSVDGDTIISTRTSDLLFTNTTDINSDPNVHEWQNANFKIPAGGYIVLTYSVTAADTFEQGSNAVSVDQNTTTSKVEYGGPQATPTPTLEPGVTQAPATPTPAPTLDPNMATLKIEKSVSRDFNMSSTVDEVVFSNLNNWGTENEFYYSVKITNTSDKPYKANRVAILDQLPEEFGVKNQTSGGQIWIGSGSAEITSKTVASVNENQDYNDPKVTWYKVDATNAATNAVASEEALEQNWMALELTREKDSEYSFVLGARETFTVIYALKLKNSFKAELEQESASNGNVFSFEQRTATNTAYFTGDTAFKNTDGTPTTVIAATKTVKVRAESIHPGIEKTAYGYLEASSSGFEYDSSGAKPGARLIWKLKVVNDKDSKGSGKTMTNYTLTDILPIGYKYDEDQTYENSHNPTVTYPTDLSDKFKNGKMIKHKADGSEVEIDYLSPTQGTEANTGAGILKWEFTADDYNLKPGEWLEFLIITEPNTEEVKSGIYYNKAVLEAGGKFYEDTVKTGTYENGNITDGDSFSINTILTSGKISVTTSTKDTATSTKDTAVGGTDDNIATGEAGKKVTYKLEVKNSDVANQSIKNVSIINRIPYVGDSGVIVSGQRGSQYDVKYQDSLKVIVHRSGGTSEELSKNNYTFTTYSGDTSKVFKEDSQDWIENDIEGWSKNWDASTKLIRIIIGDDNNPIKLASGDWIEVTYDALLPEQGLSDDSIAWNGFAYHYDSENGTVRNMAAEPASVGVILPKNNTLTGKITVKKTLSSPTTDKKTFYFSIFNKEYENGDTPIETKSIELSGGNVTHPVNADLEFTNLTYVAIGKDVKYYIYETDANGIPLVQNEKGNGYIMCKGFYRTDKGDYTNYTVTHPELKSDAETVKYVYATDEKGSNKVEVIDGGKYCFWVKGLNETKTVNSANFTNCIKQTEVARTISVKGPYYSDIATNIEAIGTNIRSGDAVDNLTTGVATQRDENGNITERDERDDNSDAHRNITYSYDNSNKILQSNKYVFGNGWGNKEGHTVATGFMATVTGGTNAEENTINEVMWDIKSDPINSEVYVKLTEGEHDAFNNTMDAKGYALKEAFTDDKEAHKSVIYKINKKDTTVTSLTDASSAVGMDTSTDENPESLGDDNSSAVLKDMDESISFDNDTAYSDNYYDAVYAELAEAENTVVKPLHWRIRDKIPAVTLGEGAAVNIGIIIDQIYDKNAAGSFTINPADTSGATKADSAKVDPYGPQADVPAYNFSGDYAVNGIRNVLKALGVGETIDLNKDYFGLSGSGNGNITSIRANAGDEKKVMLCAGAYVADGKPKNNITVNLDNVRVGSYQSSNAAYMVNGQPAPSIALKIPAGGIKLTITAKKLNIGVNTRYLTILESDGNGKYKSIKDSNGEDIKLAVAAKENDEDTTIVLDQVAISADTEKVIYLTSTGSNIEITNISTAAITN